MKLSSVFTFLAVVVSSAIAANITVQNDCDFAVWVTPVSKLQGNSTQVAAGTSWAQKQFKDEIGTAIKIVKSADGLYSLKPVLHFSYTYNEGENIYYDLSSHLGFDFWGDKLTITGDEGDNDVEEIEWNGQPKPNHTAVAWGEHDLTLTLCAK